MNFNYNYLEVISPQEDILKISLNRPDIHNAFNEVLIDELINLGEFLSKTRDIRIIVLSGNGKSFCAGADLNWMKKTIQYSFKKNKSDSIQLGNMFHIWDELPQAIIGRINGSAIGGGTGLVSICDIAVSIETAKFSFSEVNLGMSPAVISPFVINKIGIKNARELFLTGERFFAEKALKIGLVNYVVSNLTELDKKINHLINQLYTSGPIAIHETKKLIKTVTKNNMGEILDFTSSLIAKLRTSKEGQEGMSAFLEKRKSNWFKSQ